MALTAEEKKAREQERIQLSHLSQVHAAELIALRDQAKKLGYTTAEINKLVASERAANKQEYNTFKTDLSATGLQKIAENPYQIRSQASAYTGDLAANVGGLLDKVSGYYETYNMPTWSKTGNAYIGVPMDKLLSAELNRDPTTGEFRNVDMGALMRVGEKYIGKNVTKEELAADKLNLKAVKDIPGLFKSSAGSKTIQTSYWQQNEDGTFSLAGLDRHKKDDQSFIDKYGKTLLTIGAGAFLTPLVASGLGVSSATAAGIVGGAKTLAQGGSIEDALVSGLTSGVTSGLTSGLLGDTDAAFAAADAAQLAGQGLSNAAIQQNLIASGLDPVLAASAADLAVSGVGAQNIAQSLGGFKDIYGGVTTGGLTGITTNQPPVPASLSESEFIAADATQLANQGLSNAAIQQNLIGAGVDPVIAASAADQAIMGGTTGSIASDLAGFEAGGTLMPGVTTGSLTGFSQTGGGMNLKDILNVARGVNTLTNMFGQKTAQVQPQPIPQPVTPNYTGVDYTGLLNLLAQRANRANVASLLG